MIGAVIRRQDLGMIGAVPGARLFIIDPPVAVVSISILYQK
jgi:hypothetical protein